MSLEQAVAKNVGSFMRVSTLFLKDIKGVILSLKDFGFLLYVTRTLKERSLIKRQKIRALNRLSPKM